jgi:hypothetical protein
MAGKKRVPARMKAKQDFKPQGFTKKEWITMGIVVAAIVVLIIGYFLLRDFFDGSLRTHGGKVQAEDNWIVVNTGTTDKPKYFKLGTVSEVDGYTLKNEHYSGDDNVPTFVYTPDEASAIENVTLLAAKGQAEEMAGKVSANYSSYLQGAVPSEVSQVTVGGRTGWAFSCDYQDTEAQPEATATPAPEATAAEATVAAEATAAPEATPAAEATVAPEATPAPVTKAARVVSIYFDASHSMSVLASITAKADDAAQLPATDAMYKMLDPFVKGMTIDGEVASTAAPAASVEATATAAATGSDVAASGDAVVTAAPTEAAATAEATEVPAAEVTAAPTEAAAEATEAPAAEVTAAPTEAAVTAEATEAAVSSKAVVVEATATVEPTVELTAAPTPTAEPTVEPTVAPTPTAEQT